MNLSPQRIFNLYGHCPHKEADSTSRSDSSGKCSAGARRLKIGQKTGEPHLSFDIGAAPTMNAEGGNWNMEQTGSNNTRKTASTAMLGAVVDIAHSVAYPMVSEVIKTQASQTNRIEHSELMIEDNTLELQTLSARMDEVTAKATTAVADAIANIQNTPEMDETIAKMQSEINRLQAQVTGLVEVLSSVAHLE